MRVWAHVHTTHSHDGKRSVAEVGEAARRAGVQFVLLSEHSDFWSAEGFARLQAECAAWNAQPGNPHLLPGIEVTADCGWHLLCFGLPRWIEPDRPPAEIVRQARELGAFVVWAHPRTAHLDEALALGVPFHAIEVWNVKRSRIQARWEQCDWLTRAAGATSGWRALVGLDAHDEPDFLPVFLELDEPRPPGGSPPANSGGAMDVTGLLDALRGGRYRIVGRGFSIAAGGRYVLPWTLRVRMSTLAGLRGFLKFLSQPLKWFAPGFFERLKRDLMRHI